jgi:hypothetical protein
MSASRTGAGIGWKRSRPRLSVSGRQRIRSFTKSTSGHWSWSAAFFRGPQYRKSVVSTAARQLRESFMSIAAVTFSRSSWLYSAVFTTWPARFFANFAR